MNIDKYTLKVKKLIDKYILDKILSDTLVVPYLSFWAGFVLRIRKPLIVGITGSVGKTTTKEMIAAVLKHEGAAPIVGFAGSTPKNMNDDMGVPLTVLQYDDWLKGPNSRKFVAMCLLPYRALSLAFRWKYPKILVIEYGTHWKGHLHRIARFVPPHIAVVTTIGPAHLERLKTIEGVVWEKSAVVRAAPPSGLVILGQDHNYVQQLEQMARAPVIKVTGRGTDLSQNIARVVCQHLGIPEEVITSALQSFQLPQRRLNRVEFADLTVIDDTYNANPLSMKFGLETLAETARNGQRRVAILGAMAELGEEGPRYHEEIAAFARSLADLLIGVGDLARHYSPDYWFDTGDACINQIEGLIQPGDCLFVKGSASSGMRKVADKLLHIAENGLSTKEKT